MDINLIRTIVTVASFIAFLAIVAWAMHAGNRQRFEDASRLPFDEDER
ncbi:MAG: cbb3-type cytochrome oxidase subunit 3 [Usitatibacter sp.]